MTTVAEQAYARHLTEFKLPRYDEIPKIALYMDQLLSYLEETLQPLYQEGDKIITSSMVNNYVKQGILSAATSKKYNRHHIAYLIVICTLKQTFSIAEIEHLITSQINSFETDIAYDYFCSSFEEALHGLFSEKSSLPKGLIGTHNEGDFERDLVLASTAAVAYTLYIKASITIIEKQRANS